MTTTAWYIIRSDSSWARWVNLLHLPYLIWHLSYPALGAALAAELNGPVLAWTVLAFFLGMGVGAHCFDLLQGDPLRLGLPRWQLWSVGLGFVGAAAGVGAGQIAAGNVPVAVAAALPVGVLLALGYSLEWKGLHGDWQFSAWWGLFPFLVGYFAQGIDFTPALILGGAFAVLSTRAQRVLSTRARYLRREVQGATVALQNHWHEGMGEWLWGAEELKPWLLAPLDQGLMWFSLAMPGLAAMAVLWRYV